MGAAEVDGSDFAHSHAFVAHGRLHLQAGDGFARGHFVVHSGGAVAHEPSGQRNEQPKHSEHKGAGSQRV